MSEILSKKDYEKVLPIIEILEKKVQLHQKKQERHVANPLQLSEDIWEYIQIQDSLQWKKTRIKVFT